MGRHVLFAPGEYYHLYNRGTEKRTIFTSIADYKRFLALIRVSNGTAPIRLQRQGRTLTNLGGEDFGDPLVHVGAYCLMPNHFHILVQEKEIGGISKFMQKLVTGYVMYFNKRYDRTGTLFQGKYKAQHVADDRYLKYIFSYIHLNPVKLIDPKWKESGIADKVHAKQFLDSYEYSSYPDYCGVERPHNMLLAQEHFPQYFSSTKDLDKEIECWLSFSDASHMVEVRPRP